MRTDTEKKLMVELELLCGKWSREWLSHVCNDTQPTRDDERAHLRELRKIVSDWEISRSAELAEESE